MSEFPELVLIDLSSIAHPIWHISQSEPDPDTTSTRTVAKVRAIASGKDHVAVCCDSGRSFRHDVDSSYKANRPEGLATLHHQIDIAKEMLGRDGFPVWGVRGFEADDVIATATKRASKCGYDVLIVSADKDLLQLVLDNDTGPRVRAQSLRNAETFDAEAVRGRFGVRPEQMRDYLSLVGDASDNVKGAKGIGPKNATALLATFGSLDALYEAMDKGEAKLTPAVLASLTEFRERMETTRKLITLRTDVDIPFDQVKAPRVPKDAEPIEPEGEEMEEITQPAATAATVTAPALPPAVESEPVPPAAALAVRDVELAAPSTESWERRLDPQSMRDARELAKDMFASRMFSAYGSPQAVLATVMVGRELGLPAMSSLRSIHNIEGKHALSSALMVALVLKSGLAEYFEPVSFDDKSATFVTKRKGARREVTLTHTIEMAKVAGLVKEKSNWLKIPTDMLAARAQSRLARMVYPDLLNGLYTPEELREAREDV